MCNALTYSSLYELTLRSSRDSFSPRAHKIGRFVIFLYAYNDKNEAMTTSVNSVGRWTTERINILCEYEYATICVWLLHLITTACSSIIG